MKTAIKIIIALGLVFLGWYISTLFKPKVQPTGKDPIAVIKEKEIQTEAAEIKKEVDKNGLQHTIYKMVKEVDRSAVDAVKADLMDTVEALGIARKQLKQALVINTSLTITNQKLERKVSDLATTYFHADDHFRLTVNVPKDSLKSATFDAGYDADLIAVQHLKNKWLFWTDNYINVYSNDTRFTNKGLRSLVIKPRQPFFAASIEAISNYNTIVGPSAGTGLRVRLGNVTLNGNYQLFPDYNKWSWGAGASYRIVGGD